MPSQSVRTVIARRAKHIRQILFILSGPASQAISGQPVFDKRPKKYKNIAIDKLVKEFEILISSFNRNWPTSVKHEKPGKFRHPMIHNCENNFKHV